MAAAQPKQAKPQPLTLRKVPHFYWAHFAKGFCRFLPLPLMLLLLLALALKWFGTHFGVDHLIWHELWWRQFFVGFAMVLLICRIYFFAYLLGTQETRYQDRYALPIGRLSRFPLACHLPGMVLATAGSLAFVFLVMTSIRFFQTGRVSVFFMWFQDLWQDIPQSVGITPFLLGGLLGLMIFTGVLTAPLASASLHKALERIGYYMYCLPLKFGDGKPPEKPDRYLHGIAVLFFLVSVVFYFGIGMFYPLSPIVYLCFLLDGIISIYGVVKYFLHRLVAILILTASVFLLVGGIPPFKYRFPGLEKDYQNPQELSGYVSRLKSVKGIGAPRKDHNGRPLRTKNLLASDDIAFCTPDLGQHHSGQKRPLVVVCTSGGGIRAAAWTVAVLQEIERNLYQNTKGKIVFPYHTRIITGASGGMFGAAYYSSQMIPPQEFQKEFDPNDKNGKLEIRHQENYAKITKDALTPVVWRLVYGDLGLAFCPRENRRDRGLVLEEAWAKNLGKEFGSATFQDCYEDEKAGWRPSLVFAPMLVEDGRRLLISNLDLAKVVENNAPILRPDGDREELQKYKLRGDLLSVSGFEMFRLFPHQDTHESFRIRTAARMSATFPYISPAVPLPTVPRRRVVDGGYFDNYGVSLAAAWLFDDSNRQWLKDNTTGVLFIQIRDGLDQKQRMLLNMPDNDPTTPFSRGFEWLTSPPSGLYSSTTSAAALRNDELLEVLNRLLATEQQIKPLVGELSASSAKLLQELGGQKKPRQWLQPKSLDLHGKISDVEQIVRQSFPTKNPDDIKVFTDKLYYTLDRKSGSEFFKTVIFELEPKKAASLSWYLTQEEKTIIRDALKNKRIQTRIDEIYNWWQRRQEFTAWAKEH